MAETPDHNTLGGNSADQLRAYISRIENIEGEISRLNDDKRDTYREAAACGFDKNLMRQIVRRRRRVRVDLQEEDELVGVYEAALVSTTPLGP